MKRAKSLLGRIFSSTLLLLNLGAIIWLLLCYAASVLSPIEVGYFTFFSLTTPFAILVNLIFIALWLLTRGKWRALFSIAILVICWKLVSSVLGFNFFSSDDWVKGPERLKVISWNVHAMGAFDRTHEKQNAREIMDFLEAEDADLLCLPEYALHADPVKRTYTPEIKKRNGYSFFHFSEDNDYGQAIKLGTAIFSRYPVVYKKNHPLGKYIYMVQCDLKLPNDRIISVYTLHLQSFGLSDNDKDLFEEARQKRNADALSEKSRSYAWKFRRAYERRASEAEIAARIISSGKHPAIVCGDLNDLPFSYTYNTIRGDLRDVFADKGAGFGRTYNRIVPTLRIDYILYDGEAFSLKAFKTPYTEASDHNPVIANFELVDPGER